MIGSGYKGEGRMSEQPGRQDKGAGVEESGRGFLPLLVASHPEGGRGGPGEDRRGARPQAQRKPGHDDGVPQQARPGPERAGSDGRKWVKLRASEKTGPL